MAPAGPLFDSWGLDDIPPQGFRGGKRYLGRRVAGGGTQPDQVGAFFYEAALALLFPSLQLSSKNICLLFLGQPPLTSVLASP